MPESRLYQVKTFFFFYRWPRKLRENFGSLEWRLFFFFFWDHLKISGNSSEFHKILVNFGEKPVTALVWRGVNCSKKPKIWNLVIFFLDLVIFFGNSSEFWKVAYGSIDSDSKVHSARKVFLICWQGWTLKAYSIFIWKYNTLVPYQ